MEKSVSKINKKFQKYVRCYFPEITQNEIWFNEQTQKNHFAWTFNRSESNEYCYLMLNLGFILIISFYTEVRYIPLHVILVYFL